MTPKDQLIANLSRLFESFEQLLCERWLLIKMLQQLGAENIDAVLKGAASRPDLRAALGPDMAPFQALRQAILQSLEALPEAGEDDQLHRPKPKPN